MLVQFNSITPQIGIVSPIWIDVKRIMWIAPAKIPGELADGQGKPILTEGTAINVGAGGVIVVVETLNKVLEKIPAD